MSLSTQLSFVADRWVTETLIGGIRSSSSSSSSSGIRDEKSRFSKSQHCAQLKELGERLSGFADAVKELEVLSSKRGDMLVQEKRRGQELHTELERLERVVEADKIEVEKLGRENRILRKQLAEKQLEMGEKLEAARDREQKLEAGFERERRGFKVKIDVLEDECERLKKEGKLAAAAMNSDALQPKKLDFTAAENGENLDKLERELRTEKGRAKNLESEVRCLQDDLGVKDMLIAGLRKARAELLEAREDLLKPECGNGGNGGNGEGGSSVGINGPVEGSHGAKRGSEDNDGAIIGIHSDDEEELNETPRKRALRRQLQFFKAQAFIIERFAKGLEETVRGKSGKSASAKSSPGKETGGKLCTSADRDRNRSPKPSYSHPSSSSTASPGKGESSLNLAQSTQMFTQLLAEIQTLEVQKEDCEQEIRRLQGGAASSRSDYRSVGRGGGSGPSSDGEMGGPGSAPGWGDRSGAGSDDLDDFLGPSTEHFEEKRRDGASDGGDAGDQPSFADLLRQNLPRRTTSTRGGRKRGKDVNQSGCQTQ